MILQYRQVTRTFGSGPTAQPALRGIDLRGIDLATRRPSTPIDQIVSYSANDPVMLTLLQITRRLNLVDNLGMMTDIVLPQDMDMQSARYHAEAFIIAYLRQINHLGPEDMIPGRRLIVPAYPIPDII